MFATRKSEFVKSTSVANQLLDLARLDTAFADLYLRRAREVTSAQQVRTQAAAIDVRLDEVYTDPFSPGMCRVAGVSERALPALREEAVRRLEALRAEDPDCAPLYDARRKALHEAQLDVRSVPRDGSAPPAPMLARPFTRQACDRAAWLGLVPHRVESKYEEITERFHPSWRVEPGGPGGHTMRVSLTIPDGTDEALRENLTALRSRVFVTSAGTRYIPSFVAEDLLVEDFAEPAPGAALPRSPLLAALGLPGRTGLVRPQIEEALRERGPKVVEDLGLDAREYRAVCVPPDVYSRLGERLGWGREALWTHFDGYMASADGKRMPLVGGDVRFGGVHDIVAVSAGYSSDRLIARIAIVQRQRFATW